MSGPLFLDLSHTSHTRARTGVQRVSLALERGLSGRCTPVCFDPHESAWRPLEPWEQANLVSSEPARGRGSRWPLGSRVRGEMRRMRGREDPLATAAGAPQPGVIVPEIFSAEVAAALPLLFAASAGPRVAVFHDAVALQYPEFTPRSTVARFPSYMRELLRFDGIAAVSETSRASLQDYWRWLGVASAPPVAAITLGMEVPSPAPQGAAGAGAPTVLCVSSIEGRKNHAALLGGCELLWASGVRFELRLVGLANAETGAAALRLLSRLKAAGRPVRYDGPASDLALESAYRDCTFTIYPSLAEGFGLPVAESLSRGKACLCRMDGATGEIARPGGCADIGGGDAAEIASAIGRLIASPVEIARLEAQARGRHFKTWADYVSELTGWMAGLPGHP